MCYMKKAARLGLLVSLVLLASAHLALAGWKIIYTAKDSLESDDTLGYKPFKLYKGIEYAFAVKQVSGDMDIEVSLFNPGDRQIAKGIKKGDSSIVLFKPELTEKGYKLVVKNKKDSGIIRLTLAHK